MSLFSDDYLMHKQGNRKGSKWGFNYGKPNGNRKAGEGQKDANGIPVQSQSDATFKQEERLVEVHYPSGEVIEEIRKIGPKTYSEYRELHEDDFKKIIKKGTDSISNYFANNIEMHAETKKELKINEAKKKYGSKYKHINFDSLYGK